MSLPPELEAILDAKTQDLVPVCRAIAWRHYQRTPQVVELEELVSLALTGLAQAREAWDRYCVKHGFDPWQTQYFGAYVSRRANGAILDYMRALDWVTRPVREKARLMRDAGEGLGVSEDELARATGLSRAEVRDTEAELARRPVTFDASEHDVADQAPLADVEGGTVMTDLLSQPVRIMQAMPADQQVAAVLVFWAGLSAGAVAEVMGVPLARVQVLADQAAMSVHAVLAQAVLS